MNLLIIGIPKRTVMDMNEHLLENLERTENECLVFISEAEETAEKAHRAAVQADAMVGWGYSQLNKIRDIREHLPRQLGQLSTRFEGLD
jgi:hypothetical protein